MTRASQLLITFTSSCCVYSCCFLPAINNIPDDAVEFVEDIFDKLLHTWHTGPGYAMRIVGMCPPPSNSKVLVSHNTSWLE